MNIQSTRILSDSFQGQRIHRLDTNGNHRPDANEPMLVQRDGDSWKPADLNGSVDRFRFEEKFGVWTDRQVSHKEGWFWDRQEVIDRPKNGAIEADEVKTAGFRRTGNGIDGPNRFELGAEIVADSDGALYVDEHIATFGSRRIITQSDINQLEAYRQDSQNWLTPRQPVLIGSAEGPFTIGPGGTTITVPISMGS